MHGNELFPIIYLLTELNYWKNTKLNFVIQRKLHAKPLIFWSYIFKFIMGEDPPWHSYERRKVWGSKYLVSQIFVISFSDTCRGWKYFRIFVLMPNEIVQAGVQKTNSTHLRFLSFRNQSVDLLRKLVDCFP